MGGVVDAVGRVAAPATDKPHDSVVAWLRKTRAYGLVDLLCSPNAHTRSIDFLERRCSSKRASRRSIQPRPEEIRASLEGACRSSPSPPGKRARLGAAGVGRVRMMPQRQAHASAAYRSDATIHIHMVWKTSELGRIITTCAVEATLGAAPEESGGIRQTKSHGRQAL
jgi:hypothetical protein